MKLLSFFILILLLSSCSKTTVTNSGDPFIFGHYYGQCHGNCTHMFQIIDNAVYPDEVDYGFVDLRFSDEPLSAEDYLLVQDLAQDIPQELLDSSTDVYGCPDCADGGGIYLEITVDSEVRKWQFDTADTEDISESIVAYKNKLFEISSELSR